MERDTRPPNPEPLPQVPEEEPIDSAQIEFQARMAERIEYWKKRKRERSTHRKTGW